MPMNWETFNDVRAKAQSQDVQNQLGVQDFAYSKGWQTEV